MNKFGLAVLCVASFVVFGCGEKSPDKTATVVASPSQPGGGPAAHTPISGEFRLVKTESSASVFVVKDGKKSPVTNWGWVDRNARKKSIETITQTELDSYPYSGITYQ